MVSHAKLVYTGNLETHYYVPIATLLFIAHLNRFSRNYVENKFRVLCSKTFIEVTTSLHVNKRVRIGTGVESIEGHGDDRILKLRKLAEKKSGTGVIDKKARISVLQGGPRRDID